jgi:hypothetical protein
MAKIRQEQLRGAEGSRPHRPGRPMKRSRESTHHATQVTERLRLLNEIMVAPRGLDSNSCGKKDRRSHRTPTTRHHPSFLSPFDAGTSITNLSITKRIPGIPVNFGKSKTPETAFFAAFYGRARLHGILAIHIFDHLALHIYSLCVRSMHRQSRMLSRFGVSTLSLSQI